MQIRAEINAMETKKQNKTKQNKTQKQTQVQKEKKTKTKPTTLERISETRADSLKEFTKSINP